MTYYYRGSLRYMYASDDYERLNRYQFSQNLSRKNTIKKKVIENARLFKSCNILIK